MATASGQTNEEEKTSLLRELSHVFLEQVLFVTFMPPGAQDGVLFNLLKQRPSWENPLKSFVKLGKTQENQGLAIVYLWLCYSRGPNGSGA